jgi:hypothetical protein
MSVRGGGVSVGEMSVKRVVRIEKLHLQVDARFEKKLPYKEMSVRWGDVRKGSSPKIAVLKIIWANVQS